MNKVFLSRLFIPLVFITLGFFVSPIKHARALNLDYGACEPGTADKCGDLLLVYSPGGDNKFARTRVSGTLLGVNNFFQGISESQPAPANLAYWWNDNVNRVPFVGKALAAPVEYSGPFLKIILGVWKMARDVSYGLMALVMLVVGFMIITRKKIGAQAAVTAQQALPRIVIALILITFSYPIGALGASTAFVLRGSASSIVQTIDWESITNEATSRNMVCDPDKNLFERVVSFVKDLNIRRTTLNFLTSLIFDGTTYTAFGKSSSEMASCGVYFLKADTPPSANSNGKLAAVMFALVGSIAGEGPMALLIALIVLIAALVFGILVYIKFFMLYLKLLFSIVGAPLQFAFGAIPGNEEATMKWFKSFISLVISIPAMFFMFELAWQISFKAIGVALVESGRIGGGTLMLLIIPFIYIFGANFARQVPGKIDALIVGEPKKGGKH